MIVIVIPADWSPVRRPQDDELVGYLVPDPAGVRPFSAAGMPLGPGLPRDRAIELLVGTGLVALDRRHWCVLPGELPPGVHGIEEFGGAGSWRPVVLVEVSPERTVVRPEWPPPEERTSRVELPTPVGGLLRFDPPED
jgi:hypothetical protein